MVCTDCSMYPNFGLLLLGGEPEAARLQRRLHKDFATTVSSTIEGPIEGPKLSNMYIHKYILRKKEMYIYIYTHTYIYIYIYICLISIYIYILHTSCYLSTIYV